MRPGPPRRRPVVFRALAAVLVLLAAPASAGHELTFYPSYYPQEITVRVASPSAAAGLLRTNALHAYAGPDPFAAGGAPPHVSYAESLRGWLVLSFPRGAGAPATAEARCAAAARVRRALGEARAAVPHAYPVTPFHADWVHHFDLAQAAGDTAEGPMPRVRAAAAWTRALGGPGAGSVEATLDEVPLAPLLSATGTSLAGWSGPPWIKEGWYQAWLLHAGSGEAGTDEIADLARRRMSGAYQGASERVALERRLVARLTDRCERVVVGYTLRREAINHEYSAGVENEAFDAQGGVATPIFMRTTKLKDFPWNGWLHLGVAAAPAAAWNPVAGFGDDAGRLVWSAVGDPALLLDPDSARWVPNRARIQAVAASGPVDVPADALRPEPRGLRAVGAGATARARVVYRVLFSKLHDGERMTVADLLYPYVFAARWGAPGAGRRDHDPAVERATGLLREAVVGVRVVRVDKEVKEVGELQLMYDVPHVEVYLGGVADARHAPAVAPPWSPVPWHVLALMEESVARGQAAFSEREAARRGVPWLDLVRDPRQRAALAGLVAGFERSAWVPEALRGLVTPEQARARWAALREFARTHGHYLVTAGPYRLGKVAPQTITLPVFRDFSYPLGVGSWDQYPIPLRAWVRRAERRGDRLEIEADVESVEKAARSYKIVRAPFRPGTPGERTREPLTAHYTVVGPDDAVAAAGASHVVEGDRLVIELGRLRAGAYRALVALAMNGNLVNPEVKVVPFRVGDG